MWGYVWHKYAYSSPAEDPKCSEAEKVYISAGRKVQSKPIRFGWEAYYVRHYSSLRPTVGRMLN